MRKSLAVAAVLATCAACQNSIAVQREAEIVASTRYDDIDCGELAQQRNTLAARHGVARTVEREPQSESSTTGFGLIIPDTRSETERARARAIGEITAMNRSMERRRCGEA
jgi:hypothetical protein